MASTLDPVTAGLEGMVVADTAIGEVRGEEGWFHYRGHDATRLARHHGLEDVWHLLTVGHLPAPAESVAFQDRVAAAREAVPADLLQRLAGAGTSESPLTALRTAWSMAADGLGARPWLDLTVRQREEQALTLAAIGPVLVAAVAGRHHGEAAGRPPASTASAYLHLLLGHPAPEAHVRALERYLVLTLDHGLNASTFTARVVASTGADLGAVIVAALGALSGPLHGGAPSRALEMLDAVGRPERAEEWVRDRLSRGERIMGFGHRVYRTEDPRARLLRETAVELGGTRIELALRVEETVVRLLRDRWPDRHLDVNVEYYAAVVLEAVGLPPGLFTPTFAVSRVIGWTAHALEQMAGNRIMRPTARYVGPPPREP